MQSVRGCHGNHAFQSVHLSTLSSTLSCTSSISFAVSGGARPLLGTALANITSCKFVSCGQVLHLVNCWILWALETDSCLPHKLHFLVGSW